MDLAKATIAELIDLVATERTQISEIPNVHRAEVESAIALTKREVRTAIPAAKIPKPKKAQVKK